MKFATKAETLQSLREAHPELAIPELEYFDLRQWEDDAESIIAKLMARFRQGRVVVRSSSRSEDSHENSNAGAFLSLLDIDPTEEAQLRQAVSSVAASMPGDPRDQVLVQSMVQDIVVSGVIMTRCMEDGSPYLVLNYDDESGRSDLVTGGRGVSKTIHVFRGVQQTDLRSPRVRAMLALARKVEQVFGSTAIDIEFGIDRQERVYLFQARPMASVRDWSPEVDQRIADRIGFIEAFVSRCIKPKPGLHGEQSILGVMPDWNPAEMIGIMPHPLASSLYRELITRAEWRLAREAMGYRTMPAEELMVLVAGRPYIDVRASFNSFLPQGIAPDMASVLVDAWLERLRAHPELHDKVEFKVAVTCLDFGFDAFIAEFYPGLLPPGDLGVYKGLLMGLTRKCLDLSPSGTLATAEAAVAALETRQRSRSKTLTPGHERLSVIKTLAEECRLLGTRPFSILARHAFMAESLLRSAVTRGAMDTERVTLLRRSITTVASDITRDFNRVLAGQSSREDFLSRYGHLRPGSYDILSPCYAARSDIFDSTPSEPPQADQHQFSFTSQERRAVESLLAESGLCDIGADGLLTYVRRAVAGREYGKFVFTRNLSDILEGVACWGEECGFSRENVSFLTFQEILEQLTVGVLKDRKEHFQELINRNRSLFDLGQTLRLPYLIVSPRDVYVAPQHRSSPNFISRKRIVARVARLGAETRQADLAGRIVCIENADPGFDWIFSRSIAGVVTKFGGANSHMAVRCAEYGLPAAIGCGEKLFESLKPSCLAELDAVAGILRPVTDRP
ncbi:pyruvate, phosphate dikinase [Nitratidesulfovibrio sp. HK-II]|uniref:PEP-utilizing enzyme n=1 Tax=Nitratidesulfovibrio sp. HK-II TaxID=2009266 RepID=UPI000EC72389|nr:PEP-utilizing enzyme [Nitratidesulfovibrio sp. HK-II]GBO97679.1 phosphoenolpyruvate synthase [Nitratidesulfovibrio sp. HK-II]